MITATLVRQYRTRGGKKMFVYAVSGTKAEIEKFEDVQGDYLVHADDSDPKYTGKPLLFSSVQGVQNPGQTCEARLSRDESRYNVIEDTKFSMFKDALREVIRETYGDSGVTAQGSTTDAKNEDPADDGEPEEAAPTAKPAAKTTAKGGKKLAEAKM